MNVNVTVSVPDTLARQARATAALRGESLSAVVRRLLAAYVREALEDAGDPGEQAGDLRKLLSAGEKG